MRTLTRFARPALALAAVAAVSGTARADVELGVTGGPHHTGSRSVDALTADDSQGSVLVTAALGLDGLAALGFTLDAVVGYEHGSLGGVTFQRIESDLSVHSLRVGARLRRPLRPWLYGFAGLSVGWTTGELALEEPLSSGARRIEDRAHGASTALGAGLDLAFARHRRPDGTPRFELGARAEVGYTAYSSLGFEATPASGGGELAIPIAPASLGDVELSGWGFRLGLYGRL